MKLHRVSVVLFALTTVFFAVGCNIPADFGCTSDTECREGRYCNDGRCTDIVTASPNSQNGSFNGENNAEPGNSENSGENNEENNGENNTEPGNSENNDNECESDHDCNGEQICVWDSEEEDEGVCDTAWQDCDYLAVDSSDDSCDVHWFCNEVGPLVLDCEFQDVDDGFCTCWILETGKSRTFDTQPDICVDWTPEELNRECGWRLPSQQEI